MFALGDCCVTPLNEEKGILSVNQLGQVVWTNLIHKLERERLVTMPPRIQFIQGTLLIVVILGGGGGDGFLGS